LKILDFPLKAFQTAVGNWNADDVQVKSEDDNSYTFFTQGLEVQRVQRVQRD
jgi:hypothetical protein